MSPRHSRLERQVKIPVHGKQAGPDRWRQIETIHHHQMTILRPDRPHVSQRKATLPPKHTPHCHPHEEARGPHTGRPGPIRITKKISRSGIKT